MTAFASEFVYDPAQSPQSIHNKKVAANHGWTWDPDFRTWRNSDGFPMDADGEFPANPVDCLR